MTAFLAKYRVGVEAKRTLANLEDAPRPDPPKPVPKPATPAPADVKTATAAAAPATAKPTGAEWRASKTCFHCNKVGHIKLDCPDLKQTPAEPKRMNVIAMGGKKKRGPYLAVDVSAVGQQVGPVRRLDSRWDRSCA